MKYEVEGDCCSLINEIDGNESSCDVKYTEIYELNWMVIHSLVISQMECGAGGD